MVGDGERNMGKESEFLTIISYLYYYKIQSSSKKDGFDRFEIPLMVFALFYCSFFKKWSIAHPKEENKRVIKKKKKEKKTYWQFINSQKTVI